ncbi:MAG: S1 RNA-binding domain-containing protein [Flavobacteriales bacterium]
MIKLGEINKLRVHRKSDEAYFLTADYDKEAILFNRDVEKELEMGAEVEVFVYSDAEHPFIATFKEPKIKLNEFAVLNVTEVNKAGAFLDWGLPKELFVPFAEQKLKMVQGRRYLVYLYLDKISGRLVASAKINKYLNKEPHTLKPKEEVDLMVAYPTDLGVNMIINNKFTGLLFDNEMIRPLTLGEKLKGYVKSVRDDGKIDVRLRKPGPVEILDGERFLKDYITNNNGFLPLTDKSDPDEIREILGMSKKTFKQAVGALYRKRAIRLEEDGIYLVTNQ